MWQLVLFRFLTQLLSPSALPLKLYAQEPAFTPLDTAFLKSLDVGVVADGVQAYIDARSFVYAPFVDWFVLLPGFLRGRDPEVYVGNEVLGDYAVVANSEEKRGVLATCDEVGRNFLAGREKRVVPGFEGHGSAMEGLVLYWKEEGEEE